jgi:hypothetical protein
MSWSRAVWPLTVRAKVGHRNDNHRFGIARRDTVLDMSSDVSPVPVPPAPVLPVPQRRSTTKIVLLVVGAVLAVCCVGGVVGVVGGLFLERTTTSAAGVKASVNTFVDHLQAGEYDAAYDSLCTSTRESFTVTQFTAIAAGRPRPVAHSVTDVNVSNINDHVSASATATLKFADGSSESHLFPLEREQGAWKVCGDPY